ncbi:hypothetical protein [Streptomyces sp. NRRL WC-3742]|uniref:hypothetical protein n=1 Tax=Streptomyces sp. NRRL WC-3742 TaxID=1463934 RepID=UPI00131BA254|nr:hypothetical protein [Streptomyces sp. NRRL WC-3742]
MESADPEHQVVVVAGGCRFELCLTQEMVQELCREPYCGRGPFSEDIPWCATHLGERSMLEPIETAKNLGYATRDRADYEPDRCGGGAGADLLVKAAVAQASAPEMVKVLIDICFDDPDEEGPWTFDDHLEMQLRHVIDRERLRLNNVACDEARRIRRAAATCSVCSRALPPWT